MNLKVVVGITVGVILIVLIIVLVVYRKSFFSKNSSESTIDDNEEESSKEDDTTSVTKEESGYDESDFEEENLTSGTNYEEEEQEEEEEQSGYDESDFEEENLTSGTNYEVDEQEQENVEEEYYDETDYYDISNYCSGDTDRKTIFINAVSTKFSSTENNSDECRNLCSQTADCEMYLNEDENTCYLYKDVDDISMYCESGPGHEYYGNAKIKDGLHPAYEINSQTSSEVIDNILEKEGWEISTDISISDESGQWRNLFHYGNVDGTRVPAMWIIANQHWKLHFRIKTTTNWNDGLNFFVPEEFQNPGETFNLRIRYEGYEVGSSKIIVYVNDVFVEEQDIGLFTPVKNQQFNLKKSWGDKYTDKENYTISNFTLKELV